MESFKVFEAGEFYLKDLIGKKGKIDYQEVPSDAFSGGERMALVIRLD